MILPTPKEFSFEECLIYLNRSPLECLFYVEDSRIEKAMKVGNDTVFFSVQHNKSEGIQINFPNGQPNDSARQAVARYVQEWLDLERDLTPFYKMAASDPLLKPLIERYYGLRLIAIPDLFEALCWSIIGQQINLKFAYTLKKRVVETFGEKATRGKRDYWLFPSPETIAALEPEAFMEFQFSRNKAEYLIGVARLLAAGDISPDSLRNGNDPDMTRQTLLQIRGVGNWTADYVLMKCFRIPSAFPIGDVGLHNALKIQLGLSQKPSLAEIEKIAAAWKGWEAYATFYLWRSLV